MKRLFQSRAHAESGTTSLDPPPASGAGADHREMAEELAGLFTAIAEDWSRRGRADASYAQGYDAVAKVAAMRETYAHLLEHVPDLGSTTGCDLGCWLGFSTVIQASLGAALVYGLEVDPAATEVAEAYRVRHELEGMRYRALRDGVIPLQSASIDWVIINQVMCNARLDAFEASLRECLRILRPGGLLMLCDSNNPHCPATLERLRRNYRLQELGDGTPDAPSGANFLARSSLIADAFPDLAPDEIATMARTTCYLWGDGLVAAVRQARLAGTDAGRPFRPDDLSEPTVKAAHGMPNGNITDPYRIAADLERLGFASSSISVSPACRHMDNESLWTALRSSQGFYVFATRPRAAENG